MKKILILLLLVLLILNCTPEKTSFSSDALSENFMQLDGKEISFNEILEKYKGKTIFIDIWASWCHDCVGSIPKLKEFQENHKDVVFLMLSHDKTKESWKEGLEKHQIEGEHYLFTVPWKKSPFCKSIDLDWIPRYMIIGKNGKIKMYKAIEISDVRIQETINKG